MKLLACCTLLLTLPALPVQARENAYDVLGRTLAPLVNLFVSETESPNRALQAEMSLVEMTKLPAQFAGSKVDLAFEYPDKLILRGPVLGEPVAICRNEQDIWAFPGAKFEALLHGLGGPSKKKKKNKLEDFELPFPEQHLVFLPVLFQVRDQGEQAVNGVSCRILDVKLMPQLAESLDVQEWAARLWVNADYKITRLQLARPGWQIIVNVERLRFSESLPSETWRPRESEAGDVMHLDPAEFKRVMEMIEGG